MDNVACWSQTVSEPQLSLFGVLTAGLSPVLAASLICCLAALLLGCFAASHRDSSLGLSRLLTGLLFFWLVTDSQPLPAVP